jgi:hypothetical protein
MPVVYNGAHVVRHEAFCLSTLVIGHDLPAYVGKGLEIHLDRVVVAAFEHRTQRDDAADVAPVVFVDDAGQQLGPLCRPPDLRPPAWHAARAGSVALALNDERKVWVVWYQVAVVGCAVLIKVSGKVHAEWSWYSFLAISRSN